MTWLSNLKHYSADVELLAPAAPGVISEAERSVGELPEGLKLILEQANGLVCRSFRLYSAFDRSQPKKIWESLQRVNDPVLTRALGGDRELLARFLVFADVGGGFAVWDRSGSSIWFEETGEEELRQTDLSIREFIEMMVRDAE